MKHFFLALFPALLGLMMISCDDQTGGDEAGTGMVGDTTRREDNADVERNMTAMDTMRKGDLIVYPLTEVNEFPDSKLELNSPEDGAEIDGNTVQFDYEVTNYELETPTENPACEECAASDRGQHIHLIFNNRPYIAVYEPEYEHELEDGHYVVLSFLSRSYHNSVKNSDAFDVRQFTVGQSGQEEVDLSKPLLFYSRPKGTYSGEDTRKVLFDFYLVNTELSEDGHRVRATINGEEFIITEWQPYIVEGLPKGEVDFTIELIDENGELVDSPINKETRTVTFEE